MNKKKYLKYLNFKNKYSIIYKKIYLIINEKVKFYYNELK
jgi:hypothetical protein